MLSLLTGRLAVPIMAVLATLTVFVWVGGRLATANLERQIHRLEAQLATEKANHATCTASNAELQAALTRQNAKLEAMQADRDRAVKKAEQAALEARQARSRAVRVVSAIPPAKPGPNTPELCQMADDVLVKFGRDFQ